MTIAGIYLSHEGIVLGADSTTSYSGVGGYHYFNHSQKLFEIGEESTFGALTWGLGGLGTVSYRAMLAILGDDIRDDPPASPLDVAVRWADQFWTAYQASPIVVRALHLHSLAPHDPAVSADPNMRTAEEEAEYWDRCNGAVVGFCIAGYVTPARSPAAFTLTFDPVGTKPAPVALPYHALQWWGMPNIVTRLIYGTDDSLVTALMNSGHWTGTKPELLQIFHGQAMMSAAQLPMRDAIDYVHSSIYCTIKAMKFSNLPQVCGGPIEIAAITADRKFRWVRHKAWDAAITDGDQT